MTPLPPLTTPSNAPASTIRPPAPASPPISRAPLERKKVVDAATSFTSFFLYRVFKTMHQGLWEKNLKNPFSLENQGSQLFRDLLLMERSEQAVRQRGGLLTQLRNQIITDVSRGTSVTPAPNETKIRGVSSPAP